MTLLDDIKQSFRKNNLLIKLIYINIGVFVIYHLLNLVFTLFNIQFSTIMWVALPSHLSSMLFKPWTLLTHMFTHARLGHIVFNLLTFYLFGRIFLEYLPERQLLFAYIIGGLSGGVLYILGYNIFPGFRDSVDISILYGASGAVLAVMTIITLLVPNYIVSLILIGPVKLKYVALVLFIISTIVDFQFNPGGKLAHLGGAIFGLVYISNYRKGNDFSGWFHRLTARIEGLFKSSPRRPKVRVVHKRKLNDDEYNAKKVATQEEIDRILDKIKASGYESLTKEEKDTLFKASEDN